LERELHLFFLNLDYVYDFISHELQHSLNEIATTVAHFCDCWEAHGDQIVINQLKTKKVMEKAKKKQGEKRLKPIYLQSGERF